MDLSMINREFKFLARQLMAQRVVLKVATYALLFTFSISNCASVATADSSYFFSDFGSNRNHPELVNRVKSDVLQTVTQLTLPTSASESEESAHVPSASASLETINLGSNNLLLKNSIQIADSTGRARINYPLQIGRYFPVGRYKHSVTFSISGQGIATQVDVKNRWTDGSIKFAVLSALIPRIEANSKVDILIESAQPISIGNIPGFAEVLAKNPFVDASMIFLLNNGVEANVTLRQMLTKVRPVLWTHGSITSTAIIADHSFERSFDIGSEKLRAVRPIFHLTIWHGLSIAKVRFAAEASNLNAFEDTSYGVTLVTGTGVSKKIVFEQQRLVHHSGSRWTKAYWIGVDPEPINIFHNVRYLASTRVIPNFNPNLVINETQISTIYKRWKASDSSLNGAGLFTKNMLIVGGREEIGMFPSWSVDSLLSGDYRLAEVDERHSELAGAWPMNFREGNPLKKYDQAQLIPAIGAPISLFARPTLHVSIGNLYMKDPYSAQMDRINFGSEVTNNGWVPDGAHQPSPFYIRYVTTGDYWHLEQIQLWAGWSAYVAGPDVRNGFYGRGPNQTSGALSGDVRSGAWVLRNRVHAATFSMDNSKEKVYFQRLVDEAITIAEGIRGIVGGGKESSAEWLWGASVGRSAYYGALGVHPLRFWNAGNVNHALLTYYIDPTKARTATPPWMIAYMILALDHARDLGFATNRLIAWTAPFFTEPIKQGSTARVLGMYTLPTVTFAGDRYFDSWASILNHFDQIDSSAVDRWNRDWINSVDGYPLMSAAAISVIASEPGGNEAWKWAETNFLKKRTAPVTSKWSMIPR
jgi:hypothetical protein